MHGIIFSELKKFVTAKAGPQAWKNLVEDPQSGAKRTSYLVTETYPDAELVGIVQAGSKALGVPVPALLESFGEFIVPDLANIYAALIKPQWGLLDLLENTETVIHHTVRLKNPGAAPPKLQCSRLKPDQVVILYTSERKLCPVAKGIIKGLADLYKEKVEIAEHACMLKGDSQCEISVKKV